MMWGRCLGFACPFFVLPLPVGFVHFSGRLILLGVSMSGLTSPIRWVPAVSLSYLYPDCSPLLGSILVVSMGFCPVSGLLFLLGGALLVEVVV